MNRYLTTLLAWGLCAASTPATPTQRQPAKGWVVDYGDTNCIASREYGSEGNPIQLGFRPSPLGHALQIILLRAGRSERPTHVPIILDLPRAPVKTTALRYWDKKGHEILLLTVERAIVEQLREANHVAFRASGVVNEDYSVPGIAKLLEALDTCNADLRRHWNVAEDGTSKVKTPAQPLAPLASYVSDRDYPAQAIEENRSGTSKVTLMIDETGALEDCLIDETSGIATLDAMTCAIFVKRAKFRPATDDQGKPIRSIVSTRIRWLMP
jgi:TonB family protein